MSFPGLPASWKENGGSRRPPGPAATPMLLTLPGCGPGKAQDRQIRAGEVGGGSALSTLDAGGYIAIPPFSSSKAGLF